jgi:hypothetical protein
MRIKILERLESKARRAIKILPEVRRLDREKLAVEKGLAAGYYSIPQARVLKHSLRVTRQLYLVQELYRLVKTACPDFHCQFVEGRSRN